MKVATELLQAVLAAEQPTAQRSQPHTEPSCSELDSDAALWQYSVRTLL